MRQASHFRARRNSRGQLLISLIFAVGSDGPHMGRPWLNNVAPPSPVTPTARSMSQHTHINLTMVPSVHDKSVQIIDMQFCAKMTKFSNWSELNGALFWDNNLEFTLVVKSAFQQYIICLCLNLFVKIHVFETVCELTVKSLPRFMCRAN